MLRVQLFLLMLIIPTSCKIRQDGAESQLLGGINDGNTGELYTTQSNPWFVGAEPATYCIQFSSEGAVDSPSKSEVTIQVDRAFKAWEDIIQTLTPQTPGGIRTPNGDFLAGTAVANLTRNFKRIDCGNSPELRVKFETWDEEDQDYLSYTSKHTIAYTRRTSYNEKTGRSQGYIWISPDTGPRSYQGPSPDGSHWSHGAYLFNVMLHEVGHIFGLPHIPTSFMDANFPAGVLADGMSEPWQAQDFKSFVGLFGKEQQCGTLAAEASPTGLGFLEGIFGIMTNNIHQVCWAPAHDRILHPDEDTPMLFTIKGPQGNILAEQLFRMDGAYGSVEKISGNYLEHIGPQEFRYRQVTHAYYTTEELFRMHFTRNNRQYWVEAELQPPGLVAFRFAYDGPWKTLPVFLITPSEFHKLSNALHSVSYEDDHVIDEK